MIKELIEEIFIECFVCLGKGSIYVDEEECENCLGEGKVLSDDGEKLRHLILKGELP